MKKKPPTLLRTLKIHFPSTLGLILILCGCGTSQVGSRVPIPLAKRYDASPYPVPELVTSLSHIFPDRQLRNLAKQALIQNPDLAASAARLDESGFNLTQVRAPLLPALNGTFSGNRTQTNNFGSANSSFINNFFSANLNATWELDVWGRIRNDVHAATSDQAALAADFASAQQSLTAQIYQAWFNLIASNKLLNLAQRESESLAQTQQLTERRFERGTLTLSELEVARTDAANSLADLEPLHENRDQAARQLKVLVGDYPDAQLQGASEWPSLSRSIPTGIPSSLLRSRPDIDAAYQRVLAADTRIKVAHADLFPNFTLSASAGRSSSNLRDLLRSASDAWSIGGNLLAPIFDAGARRAELGASHARAQEAYSDYRGTVLTALQEVENALSASSRLRSEEHARDQALLAARKAEARARRDFEAGITDLLSFLETQRRAFLTEEQTITIRNARYNNRVALALALGKSY